MMKITLRIPLAQYSYMEFPFEGTPEEAIEEHNRILLMYNGGFGLENKEFNRVYDALLTKGKLEGDPGIIEQKMDVGQQRSINDLKKALKRLDN